MWCVAEWGAIKNAGSDTEVLFTIDEGGRMEFICGVSKQSECASRFDPLHSVVEKEVVPQCQIGTYLQGGPKSGTLFNANSSGLVKDTEMKLWQFLHNVLTNYMASIKYTYKFQKSSDYQHHL